MKFYPLIKDWYSSDQGFLDTQSDLNTAPVILHSQQEAYKTNLVFGTIRQTRQGASACQVGVFIL